MLFRSPNCCSRILQGVFVKRHRSSIHQRKNRAGAANVSTALPSPRELDSHECNSTFRELIPKFEETVKAARLPSSVFAADLKFTLRS